MLVWRWVTASLKIGLFGMILVLPMVPMMRNTQYTRPTYAVRSAGSTTMA
jgi:hypothetical protein